MVHVYGEGNGVADEMAASSTEQPFRRKVSNEPPAGVLHQLEQDEQVAALATSCDSVATLHVSFLYKKNGKWEMREAMGSLFSKLDQEIKLRICLDIDLKIKIGSINL